MLEPFSNLRNAIQQLRRHLLLGRLAKTRRLNGRWSGREGSPRVLIGLRVEIGVQSRPSSAVCGDE